MVLLISGDQGHRENDPVRWGGRGDDLGYMCAEWSDQCLSLLRSEEFLGTWDIQCQPRGSWASDNSWSHWH